MVQDGPAPSQNPEELERKVFDYFTLSQLGKTFTSITTLKRLAEVLVASVMESSSARTAAFLVVNHERTSLELCHHVGPGLRHEQYASVRVEANGGLFWQVLNGGTPFLIRDSHKQYRFHEIVTTQHLDRLDSLLWVPMMVNGVLLAVLTLGEKKDRAPYSQPEISYISEIASQAAVALNALLLDQERERARVQLSQQMKSLSVLFDVSRALNFTNDLRKTLRMILDRSKDSVNAQKGSIMLLNPETNELEVRVVRGIDPITEQRINEGEMECTKIKIGEGLAGRAANQREVVVANEVRTSKEFIQSKSSNVENIICLPLIAGDELIGVMNVSNKRSGSTFSKDEIDLLTTLAGQAAMTIKNANLYHLAITDGLTQLYIHRYFDQKLAEEVRRALRYHHPLSLCFIDLDHFKSVNDTYGHSTGDRALLETAKAIRVNLRETDLACRYGGEEFAVLMPETSTEEALMCAERLRSLVEQIQCVSDDGRRVSLRISVGVATIPAHASDAKSLVLKADQALYRSKEKGRNRVTCADPLAA